jgi:DNA polymerase (family 10)
MLLPYAQVQADKILEYLKKGPGVKQADPLGSLRRKVATIGDLDFAVSADDPDKVYEYFSKMPGVSNVTDKQTVVLKSGVHVDLLVGKPESYGALLQHFTGGKNHNIKLRTYALKKGLSLNEDGVKTVKTGKIIHTRTEEEFYKLLKMEIRKIPGD